MITKKFNEQSESYLIWEQKAYDESHIDSINQYYMGQDCISMTNERFITEIFKLDEQSTDYSPLVCSIEGDPSSASWSAQQCPTSACVRQIGVLDERRVLVHLST